MNTKIKILFSFAIALSFNTLASTPATAHECETSCSQACINFVNTMQNIIFANQAMCGANPNPNPTPIPQNYSCQDMLSVVHPEYRPQDLDYVCLNRVGACVASAARAHHEYGGEDLRYVCENQINDCVGRVATAHHGWGGEDLRYVCQNSHDDCAARGIELHPQWGGEEIRAYCHVSKK